MNDLEFDEKKFFLNKTTILYSNKCTDAHEIL